MTGRSDAYHSITEFLLGRAPPPAEEVVRAFRLGSYVYSILPEGDPLRAAFRLDYIGARMRHERIRRELVPLLTAWEAAGVRVLLFKGFYLAEFVYPQPGARFHGDVDLLIPPESAEEARRIALRLGWLLEAVPDEFGPRNSHCVFTLYRVGGATHVDVHRWMVYSGALSRVPERVTAAVWEGARPREWEGTTVWEPQPIDSLLVGLVLQRAWGDRFAIKPHDPIDFRILCERFGLTRDDLTERARELRCSGTLARFLRRCDPLAGRLELGGLPDRQLWWTELALSRERSPRHLEQLALYLKVLREVPADVARALPIVLRMRRAARRSDLPALLDSLTPPTAPGDESIGSDQRRVVRGIRWLTARIPFIRAGDSLVRSLAVYAELRRHGYPAVFITGRWDERAGSEHSWVEVHERAVSEQHPAPRYPNVFRYPPTG